MKETILHGPHCTCKSTVYRYVKGKKSDKSNHNTKYHPVEVDSDGCCIHCGYYAVFNHRLCQHNVERVTNSVLTDKNYRTARDRENGIAFLGL